MKRQAALLVGVAGLIAWVIGLHIDPAEALNAWLFAFAAVATVLIGMLMHVSASYLTRAIWFTVMRRLAVGVIGAIPFLILLGLPLWFGLRHIYPWASVAPTSLVRDAVAAKPGWLTPRWFLIRSAIYLVIWSAAAEWFRRRMLAQDRAPGTAIATLTTRLRRGSALVAVAGGLAFTFAAFDWMMSLDPAWHSTIYGVYVFAGGYLSALALSAVLSRTVSRADPAVDAAISPSQRSKLGTLTFAFVMFWAYTAFSQFLIIWIGDIPAEATWYVARGRGGWGLLAMIVLAGEFALPFVLLLSKRIKRNARSLAWLGTWIVAIHLLDIYWLVVPAIHPGRIQVSWEDVAALLAVAGLTIAFGGWRMRGVNLVPVGDPDLERAIG